MMSAVSVMAHSMRMRHARCAGAMGSRVSGIWPAGAPVTVACARRGAAESQAKAAAMRMLLTTVDRLP